MCLFRTCAPVCCLQLPEALHHNARGQAGWISGHVRAGVPHTAARVQAQDEEPGVDQWHLCAGRRVPVSLRGRLLHRQGVCEDSKPACLHMFRAGALHHYILVWIITLMDGFWLIVFIFSFSVSCQDMIHIADTKVARRYGDFFIRQIHKFEEVRSFFFYRALLRCQYWI